jgi:hydrogenase maturation protein HypF
MDVRRQIEVAGIVQGVGFRPYVYRLATERHLVGNISNTARGVSIEVQGPFESVEDFVERLPADAPRLSRITDIKVQQVPCNGESEFLILASRGGEAVHTLISPDVATCPDCLREVLDPKDRRYRYPFINCTNCGPRFAIVHDIPYDRRQTSMSAFPMCPTCQREYDNPFDRRFHAQPNACWDCGPRAELWDRKGRRIGVRDPIAEAAAGLHAGMIVAVKGLGGFHLAADAMNAAAVKLLRERKRRVEKPFAVMVSSLEVAEQLCEVDPSAREALLSVQRPIVLLPRKKPSLVAEAVAPRNRYLGVFLPYTPLQHLLLADEGFTALVMTSGNLSEEPIAIRNDEAVERLSGLADYFLVHNRDILLRCDDSVVRVAAGKIRQVRRSRGFVPMPVFVKDDLPPILAVGGELKNTICVTGGKHAFLSQHVGDLENAQSYEFFEEAVGHLTKILEIQPEIVAHDLHPDYFSTKWALQQEGVKLVGVQHHHAHIASCMAENGLEGRVIGFALDGTGYGTDGHIWGGEVLTCDYENFHRAAHLDYVAMPGGAAAIREPWRMAVSYLYQHLGPNFMRLGIPFVKQLDGQKTELLLQMLRRRVNSPLTSSCGRLFDAVAALAGIRQQVNYEAQAAIELEMVIQGNGPESPYPFELVAKEDTWIIDSKPMFEALIADLARGELVSRISTKFHLGLATVLARVAGQIRRDESLNRVCLSGGTLQNGYLFEHLESYLLESGFEVFSHSEVPCGDGGLSLGQAMIAARKSGSSQANRTVDRFCETSVIEKVKVPL